MARLTTVATSVGMAGGDIGASSPPPKRRGPGSSRFAGSSSEIVSGQLEEEAAVAEADHAH